MASSNSALAIRASRHLTLCGAMALVFCGSSSCHFHSGSSSHDHSAHCDENHVDGDEICDPQGAPAADDGAAETPGPEVVIVAPRGSSLRRTSPSRSQGLQQARDLAAGQGRLESWATNTPVLLSVVVGDEFIVVNVVQGANSDVAARVTGSDTGQSHADPATAAATEAATHLELVFDRHGLLLARSPGVPRGR